MSAPGLSDIDRAFLLGYMKHGAPDLWAEALAALEKTNASIAAHREPTLEDVRDVAVEVPGHAPDGRRGSVSPREALVRSSRGPREEFPHLDNSIAAGDVRPAAGQDADQSPVPKFLDRTPCGADSDTVLPGQVPFGRQSGAGLQLTCRYA